MRDEEGERAVAGIENASPAGVVTAGATPAVIGYRSGFAEVELPRRTFDAYLREEGLENRITPGDDGVQRERYARFAKSILGTLGATRPLGWRFEVVPSGPRAFVVLYEGAPLAGTLVLALAKDGRRLSGRTDSRGRVSFDLAPGVWLVKTVHMVAAPADSGVRWESLWASVTFEK
jgi:hypothetical protein